MFSCGCRNILKDKVVFLLFGELSKAEAVGLNGRFRLKELQDYNSFWYCVGYGSMIFKGVLTLLCIFQVKFAYVVIIGNVRSICREYKIGCL